MHKWAIEISKRGLKINFQSQHKEHWISRAGLAAVANSHAILTAIKNVQKSKIYLTKVLKIDADLMDFYFILSQRRGPFFSMLAFEASRDLQGMMRLVLVNGRFWWRWGATTCLLAGAPWWWTWFLFNSIFFWLCIHMQQRTDVLQTPPLLKPGHWLSRLNWR